MVVVLVVASLGASKLKVLVVVVVVVDQRVEGVMVSTMDT